LRHVQISYYIVFSFSSVIYNKNVIIYISAYPVTVSNVEILLILTKYKTMELQNGWLCKMFVKNVIFDFWILNVTSFLKIAQKFKSVQVTYYDEFPIKKLQRAFFYNVNVYIDERAAIKTHDDEWGSFWLNVDFHCCAKNPTTWRVF